MYNRFYPNSGSNQTFVEMLFFFIEINLSQVQIDVKMIFRILFLNCIKNIPFLS